MKKIIFLILFITNIFYIVALYGKRIVVFNNLSVEFYGALNNIYVYAEKFLILMMAIYILYIFIDFYKLKKYSRFLKEGLTVVALIGIINVIPHFVLNIYYSEYVHKLWIDGISPIFIGIGFAGVLIIMYLIISKYISKKTVNK